MGNVVSTLTMRLIDGITGPARKVKAALAGVDAAAKKSRGSHGAAVVPGGRGGGSTILAGAGSLAAAAGAYVGAGSLKQAYTTSAELERRLTYIRQTAGATKAEAAGIKAALYQTAFESAQPVGKVLEGLESLIAAGRSVPDAMAFLPSVSKAAIVAGGDVVDMAKTADAFGVSMGITADRAQEAFDKIITAGREGKFEAKDMAHHLGSILPLAASKGFKGMEGFEKVLAYLQAIRTGTGSAEEAADSFRDMLGKISTDETKKKFKRFGIDIDKEMKKVRERGGNEFDRMGELIQQALSKGAQVTDLFADIQAYRGWLAFNQQLQQTPALLERIRRGAGATKAGLGDITGDSLSAIQQLSNSWDEFLAKLGTTLHSAGVTTLLRSTSNELGKIAGILDNINSGDYKKAAEGVRDFLDGRTDEEKKKDAEEARRREYSSEYRRQPTYDALIDDHELTRQGILQAMADPTTQTKRAQGILKARLAEVEGYIAELRAKSAQTNSILANSIPLAQGPTGTPPQLYSPLHQGQRVSGATRARPRANLGTGEGNGTTVPDATMRVQLDDASATAAGQAAHAKAQAAADALGPIRFRAVVDAPSVSGALGKSVSDGVNGSHSDNGGRR